MCGLWCVQRSILAIEGQTGASSAPEEILMGDFYRCVAASPVDTLFGSLLVVCRFWAASLHAARFLNRGITYRRLLPWLPVTRRYIVHDIEPPYSGRLNLTTVALIEAFGVSSETREVVDLADYMAQYVAEPAEAEVARL